MPTPDYFPHQVGPLFPEDTSGMVGDVETYLRATDRDVADAVELQNIRDMAEDSYKLWLQNQGIDSAGKPTDQPPQS